MPVHRPLVQLMISIETTVIRRSLTAAANPREVADPGTVTVAERWPSFFHPMRAGDAL
jgi:hypothetical protein